MFISLRQARHWLVNVWEWVCGRQQLCLEVIPQLRRFSGPRIRQYYEWLKYLHSACGPFLVLALSKTWSNNTEVFEAYEARHFSRTRAEFFFKQKLTEGWKHELGKLVRQWQLQPSPECVINWGHLYRVAVQDSRTRDTDWARVVYLVGPIHDYTARWAYDEMRFLKSQELEISQVFAKHHVAQVAPYHRSDKNEYWEVSHPQLDKLLGYRYNEKEFRTQLCASLLERYPYRHYYELLNNPAFRWFGTIDGLGRDWIHLVSYIRLAQEFSREDFVDLLSRPSE